jgi:hypothetical protein
MIKFLATAKNGSHTARTGLPDGCRTFWRSCALAGARYVHSSTPFLHEMRALRGGGKDFCRLTGSALAFWMRMSRTLDRGGSPWRGGASQEPILSWIDLNGLHRFPHMSLHERYWRGRLAGVSKPRPHSKGSLMGSSDSRRRLRAYPDNLIDFFDKNMPQPFKCEPFQFDHVIPRNEQALLTFT